MMRSALALGRRGLGRTRPNPSVGCVIARGGRVLARARTADGGRPHAEALALDAAGEDARGADLYVTLEPCAHYGATPPCADAILAAGLRRVVIALGDPDPRVNGGGAAALGAGGIAVETGLMAAEAAEDHAGFLTRIRLGRPLVTLKLAASLDGRIATGESESRWITGPDARAQVHRLRARADAVVIGVGSAISDDPSLDVRLPGLEDREPSAIVFDSSLHLPPDGRLAAQARARCVMVVASESAVRAAASRAAALEAAGVQILIAPPDAAGRADAAAALRMLGDLGYGRLLVEGGGRLAASLLGADLVDRLIVMHAPLMLGGDGVPAVDALPPAALAAMPRFAVIGRSAAGEDSIITMRRR